MTGRAATFAVLEQIGSLTSLDELQEQVSRECGKLLDKTYLCTLRKEWREEEGLDDQDCRTYTSQHRRNMFDDDLHETLYNVLEAYVGGTWDELIEILKMAHSVDQLRKAAYLGKRIEAAKAKAFS
jgi:hypothetical protein